MNIRFVVILIFLAWGSVAFGDEINDAARSGDVVKAKALLKANPSLASTPYFDGWTPLHEAADNGDYAMAKLLVSYKAEINVKGKGGRTPLHLAVMGDHQDIVKLLLASGAGVNMKDDDGVSPLHYAVWHGYAKVAKMLLAKGANGHAIDNHDETALGWATERGDKAMIKLLRK